MKLEKLEEIRSALQKVYKKTLNKKILEYNNLKTEKNKLIEFLEISELSNSALLKSVNESRKKLNIPEIIELENNTAVDKGIEKLINSPVFHD